MRHAASALILAALLAAPASASGLSQEDAEAAAQQAWNDDAAAFAEETAGELADEAIQAGSQTLRFKTVQFADHIGTPCAAPCAAEDGHLQPLFISLHGGGGTTAEANDQQWQNQIALAETYAPAEGIYLAPRAPTDQWDCWHGAGVDALLARLIQALVASGTVDPDRIYLMGYSAGGDGVYALAPRMADRFAAASMMAGHPNGISLAGVRNLPFSIQVGELDDAYDRANVARQYGAMLDTLQQADPDGYVHFTKIHQGKGHWMDGDDRIAVPWMKGSPATPSPPASSGVRPVSCTTASTGWRFRQARQPWTTRSSPNATARRSPSPARPAAPFWCVSTTTCSISTPPSPS